MTELRDCYLKEPLDHEGHAVCVEAKYPDLYLFSDSFGWLIYKDGYWQSDGAESSVGRAIKNVLRERHKLIDEVIVDAKQAYAMGKLCAANSGSLSGIKQWLKTHEKIEAFPQSFDNHPELLNVKNGVVNLKTGELLPHSPDYRFTYRINIAYNKEARCEAWELFINSLGMAVETVLYLKRVCGYGLTGLTVEEIMFYLWGPTRSGKGTFTNTYLGVIDGLGLGVNFRMFTATRDGDTQNFDFAPLKNKRVVSASESKRNERINSSVFKQVTGGDPVFTAYKGKDGFSYTPQWKLFLSSNYPLDADPTDPAVWARVHVIPFRISNLGKEDKTLKQRLSTQEAREGVLAWMVAGAVDWYENGLNPTDEIIKETQKMRLQASSVLLFVDHCCSLQIDQKSAGSALYAAYVEWCHAEGFQPYGRKNFTQALEQIGCTVSVTSGKYTDSGKSVRHYTNITYLGNGMGDASITARIEMGMF